MDIYAFWITLYIDLDLGSDLEGIFYSGEDLFNIFSRQLTWCSTSKVDCDYFIVFVVFGFFFDLRFQCFYIIRDFFVFMSEGYEVAVQADRFAKRYVYIE